MVAEVQRAKVERQLGGAVAAGARVLAGETTAGTGAAVLAPTVVVDVDDGVSLLTTETFGPVAPVQRVGSVDEAIARANALPYGRQGNVYAAGGLRAALHGGAGGGHGLVQRPAHRQRRRPVRRHGVRQRPRAGPGGLEPFARTKHVLGATFNRKPWWYPYGQEG